MNMNKSIQQAMVVLLFPLFVYAEDVQSDPYPFDTCPVTGYKLTLMGPAQVVTVEGSELAVCCEVCAPEFVSQPRRYLHKVAQAIIEQQQGDYPLDECLVTGEALGEKAVDYVYKNRLYRFHSEECIDVFREDPARYAAKHAQAVKEKQPQPIPVDACDPGQHAKAPAPEAKEIVVGQHLLRLKHPACEQALHEKPWLLVQRLESDHDREKEPTS